MSATEAGTHANLGRAHMSHIETGRTGIPEDKLRTLLHHYGCASETLTTELAGMASSNGRGWWSGYSSPIDERARDLAEAEGAATTHRSLQWLYVQGLLQTHSYMQALFENGDPDTSASEVERFIDFRLRRQQVLHGEAPLKLHAVIHEAAFHMHFVPREVMRDQLRHLVTVAQLPNVSIQLLPFKAPTYPATSTFPFVILDSAVPELRTVYVEHPVTSAFLSDSHHMGQFATDFERLSSASLEPLGDTEDDGQGSLSLVQHLLYIL